MAVVVVGSLMIDLVSYAKRLPRPGETVHGTRFVQNFGGKGANQCIAANRLGAHTAMVGRVGDDTFGQQYLDYFKLLPRMNIEQLISQPNTANGIAPIWVDQTTGQNSIIIIPGANSCLSAEDVRRAHISVIRPATVLVTQLEVPPDTTLEALKLARMSSVLTIFNPAPYAEQLNEEIYRYCDIVCPNEVECEQLTGIKIFSDSVNNEEPSLLLEGAEKAVQYFFKRGCRCVIITLGKRGCLYCVEDDKKCHVVPVADAAQTAAVDTTGAGDAFVGSLAFFLAGKLQRRIRINKGDKCGGSDLGNLLNGNLIKEAVEFAGKIASLSVLTEGTQPSYPHAKDLPSDLKKIAEELLVC